MGSKLWVALGPSAFVVACAAAPLHETVTAHPAQPPSYAPIAPIAPVAAAATAPAASSRPGERGDIVQLVMSGGVCARFANDTVQCSPFNRTPAEPGTPLAVVRDSSVAGVSGPCTWFKDGALRCGVGAPTCASTLARYPSAADAAQDSATACSNLPDGNVSCVKTVKCASPTRLRDVALVAVGGQVCARMAGGSVACADPLATELLDVPAAKGAVALSASSKESCAVMPSGKVLCWQNGHRWYLDNESRIATTRPPSLPPTYAPAPAPVDDLINVAALDLGDGHSCALMKDRTVRCWGYNDHGQLGDGTKEERVAPVPVRGLTDAVEVRVGQAHSCARLGDGSVRCWGENSSGTIDSTGRDHLTPSRVASIPGALQLAIAGPITCVLTTNKQVVCWGCQPLGRCGLGYTEAMAKRDRDNARKTCAVPVSMAWLP